MQSRNMETFKHLTFHSRCMLNVMVYIHNVKEYVMQYGTLH
jgi:hypothetical protein